MNLDISSRLKEERERLGLSQAALAEVGEKKKLAQLKYEQGDSSPTASYMTAISRVGVDIIYVLTGQRGAAALSSDESELLRLYRAAPLAVKMAAVGALQGGLKMKLGKDAPSQSRDVGGTTQTINGSIGGDNAGRDIIKTKDGERQ